MQKATAKGFESYKKFGVNDGTEQKVQESR